MCYKHTLNNLFQCQLFTRSKLDEIAIKLTQDSISSGVNGSSNSYIEYVKNIYNSYFNQHKSNYDVNVLQAALEEHDLETQWFDSRKDIRTLIQFNDKTLFGLILNVMQTKFYFWKSNHWFAIKPMFDNINNNNGDDVSDGDEYVTNKLLLEDATVWNLDSKLSKPHKFLNSEELKDLG
nr:2395_t:CDS:2 [Entrophospora candida]